MRQSSTNIAGAQKNILAYAQHFLSVNIKSTKANIVSSLVNGILQAGTLIAANGNVATTSGGVAQVETATVVGTITTSGNAKVTITAFGMLNSPKDIEVAVLATDTAAIVAGKIRTALAADSDVSEKFTIGGSAAQVTLTVKTIKDKDTTLNIAIADDTCVGLTASPTSVNTTAPAAATTNAYGVLLEDVDFNNSKGTEILPVVIHGFVKEDAVAFSEETGGKAAEIVALNMIKFL